MLTRHDATARLDRRGGHHTSAPGFRDTVDFCDAGVPLMVDLALAQAQLGLENARRRTGSAPAGKIVWTFAIGERLGYA